MNNCLAAIAILCALPLFASGPMRVSSLDGKDVTANVIQYEIKLNKVEIEKNTRDLASAKSYVEIKSILKDESGKEEEHEVTKITLLESMNGKKAVSAISEESVQLPFAFMMKDGKSFVVIDEAPWGANATLYSPNKMGGLDRQTVNDWKVIANWAPGTTSSSSN
jgi:hypothetical protein